MDLMRNIFPLYLLFLTPFFIIPGIAVVETSAVLLIAYFFLKNKDLHYFKDQKFLFLILFAVYVALNAFFQIYDNLKFSSFFFFRFSLLALSIFFLLNLKQNVSDNHKKIILLVLITFNIIIFFDSHLQFFTGKNLLGFEIYNSQISSIFGSELILGSFLIKLLPIIIFLFFYSNIEIKKYSLLLIFFLSFYFSVVYLAAGRTPFYLMILFIFLCIALVKDLRKILNLSLLVLFFFILSTFIFEFGKSNPGNRIFFKTFNQITNNFFIHNEFKILKEDKLKKNELKTEIKIFSSDHHGHYILAYELFKKNPIFGVGPKGFRQYCRSVEYDPPTGICSTHPHNFLIQITAETGVIGLIFYLSSLIFIIMKLFKGYKNKNLNYERNCFLVISIGVIINFFPFVPNGNFFNNWISIINFYYIGFYMFSYKKIFH